MNYDSDENDYDVASFLLFSVFYCLCVVHCVCVVHCFFLCLHSVACVKILNIFLTTA